MGRRVPPLPEAEPCRARLHLRLGRWRALQRPIGGRPPLYLVMIGVLSDGTKELITVEDGYRESAESWKTVLRDLKRRGMRPPVVAVGDGALGFWAAVRDVWPKTREQRDWFHKLGNVIDKFTKRLQPREIGRASWRDRGLNEQVIRI